jgi:hypothetical protein
MASSGMLRHVALVRTYVSEELSCSIIRVTRIGELGTMLAVTSNRRMLRRNTKSRATGHNIPEDAILRLNNFMFCKGLWNFNIKPGVSVSNYLFSLDISGIHFLILSVSYGTTDYLLSSPIKMHRKWFSQQHDLYNCTGKLNWLQICNISHMLLNKYIEYFKLLQ